MLQIIIPLCIKCEREFGIEGNKVYAENLLAVPTVRVTDTNANEYYFDADGDNSPSMETETFGTLGLDM